MQRVCILIVAVLFLAIPCHAFGVEQIEFKKELADPNVGRPLDVVTDEQGNIYIADKERKGIQVLDKNGQPKAFWGGKEKAESEGWQIKTPSGVAIYGDKLYVTDSSLDRVLIFSREGKYIDGFGSGGSKPKEFSSPSGICVARDAIYVADSGNRRIQIFSIDGIYTGFVGSKEELDKPKDVAVDYKGYIYVADTESVKVFTPQGKLQSNYHVVKEPSSITADISGFYVSDNSIYQVKKFDFKGNPVFSFGTEGGGKAQFKSISGISINPEGNIFVADSKKRTIQIFYAKQALMQVEDVPYPTAVRWSRDIKEKAHKMFWDGDRGVLYGVSQADSSIFVIDKDSKKVFQPPIDKGWEDPRGMAVDNEGFLWVSDSGNDRIIKLDKNGSIISYIGSSGSKIGYFSKPLGIAISDKGIIYVADTGNERIQTFNKDGVFLKAIKERAGVPLFDEPVSLTLDRSANVYVVDRKLNKVFVFDSDGNLSLSWGTEGNGRGQFNKPSDILLTATEVFVLDAGNQRVQVFDRKGGYLREFGSGGMGKGDFSEPASFVLKNPTEILVSDPDTGRIQSFSILYTPKNPSNLKATGDMRKIILAWDGSTEEFIDRYKIYRSEDKINFKEIASVGAASFEDRDVLPEALYCYRVSAVAKGGYESGKSNMVEAVSMKYMPSQITWFSTSPGERDVTITWQASTESFVTEYAVYREEDGQFTLLGKVKEPMFVDRKVKPNTRYVYKFTAVSSDGIESEAVTAKVTTLKQTSPPIDMAVKNMTQVFSNNYKLYETEPIGILTLTNNTGEGITKLKVALMIKEFMDFPTEKEIENLEHAKAVDIAMNPVFNNKILDITENTAVQVEIKMSYYEGKDLQVYTTTVPLNIYEMHHLTWDIRDKVATFVTPKDPVVLEFAREIARQYSDINPDPLIYARAIFDAFGVLGIAYMPDPNNPYQVSSETLNQVDYIQYPRETLMRKTGDCDDLVNLYSASLESLGVHTSLLDMPGHILIMFSTGLDKELVQSDTMKDMFIIHEDYAWVPVEVTLVGSNFVTAWQKGVSTYNEWRDKGLTVIDLRKAWETFKPASLPSSTFRAAKIKREDIEAKFADELAYIKNLRVRYLSRKYLETLSKNPRDVNALLQMGIIYAENNDNQALEFFKKVLIQEPQNVNALNNLGNIYFMRGKYEEAKKFYLDASNADPEDPYMLVNLARCYLKLNMKREAKEAFDRAYALNPEVARLYQSIAFQLADPSLLFLDSESKDKPTEGDAPTDKGTTQ